MDETNLLSLIRPWLNTNCQITTKRVSYRVILQKILQLNKALGTEMRWDQKENGKGGGSTVCFAQIVPAGTGTAPTAAWMPANLGIGIALDWIPIELQFQIGRLVCQYQCVSGTIDCVCYNCLYWHVWTFQFFSISGTCSGQWRSCFA
jgi:hypothetical protein